jgi:hypothetical protein
MTVAVRIGFEAVLALGLIVAAAHGRPFAAYVMLIMGFGLVADIFGNLCARTGGSSGLRDYKL